MNIFLHILGIVVVVLGIAYSILKNKINKQDDEKPKSKNKSFLILIAGLLIFILGSSFAIIPTGSTGVKTTFGQIDNRTLSAGFNWKIPFIQSVEEARCYI